MYGDLGNETAKIALDAVEKLTEVAGKVLAYIFNSLFLKDYDKKLKKEQLKQIKANKEKSYRAGYNRAKRLQQSNESISYAKYGLTLEQLKEMNLYAKQRNIPISWIQNGNDKDSFIAMYLTKDSMIVEDITEQLIRNTKIRTIEDVMKETTHYKKTSFENAINSLGNGQLIDVPVFVCDRNNPLNYMEISSAKEMSDEGRPYINTEFKVFNHGKKQKCSEFKHGRFTHYSDSQGNNTTNHGDEHWHNMKKEIKEKGGFSDDLLLFDSEKDYLNYVEQYYNDPEKNQEESNVYDELEKEKENIIREDINEFNDKQANVILKEIGEEEQIDSETALISFNDTVDRFQCNGWEKEEPYYVCERIDPDNYMEVNSVKAEFRGEEYTKHIYTIYVDDEPVVNPKREDMLWTDERFEERPKGFWHDMKSQMKAAGKFTDDLVVFYSKEEMLEYRRNYELEKENLDLNKSLSEVNDYTKVINELKVQLKSFEDIGKYENGTFLIDTGDNLVKIPDMQDIRVAEAVVIAKQIAAYEKVNSVMSEITSDTLQLKVNEEANFDNKEVYEKIQNDLVNRIDNSNKQKQELLEEIESLSENREKLAGITAERVVSGKKVISETNVNHREDRLSMKQLKEEVSNNTNVVDKVVGKERLVKINDIER